MIRGHGCLDFDDSTDDKEYVFDVKRTLQSVAKREIAALARTMIKDGDCFFSTPAQPALNWRNAWPMRG